MKPTRGGVATPLVDFTGLYERHAAHVNRFALYVSGDQALADDLTSEAFVRVWTARDRVELSTVRAYLPLPRRLERRRNGRSIARADTSGGARCCWDSRSTSRRCHYRSLSAASADTRGSSSTTGPSVSSSSRSPRCCGWCTGACRGPCAPRHKQVPRASASISEPASRWGGWW